MKITKLMNAYVLLVVALLLPIGVFAQKIDKQTRKQIEVIKNSRDKYLWGEGSGATDEEADNNALRDLIEQISVNVSSSTDISSVQTQHDDEMHYDLMRNSQVQTSSCLKLTNTRSLIVSFAPNARVIRYVTLAELDSIFNLRKEKAVEKFRDAKIAEDELRIGDALRSYFWGYCLLQTLRYPDKVEFTDEEGVRHKYSEYVPQKMEEIFANLKMEVTSKKGDELETYVTYKGKPVVNVDYRYFNGQQFVADKVKGGMGCITLLDGDAKHLQVKYEYVFEGNSHLDKEVESVVKIFKNTPFPNATVSYPIKVAKLSKEELQSVAEGVVGMSEEMAERVAVDDKAMQKQYEKVMEDVVKALKSRKHESVKKYFTESGWEMYDKLLHYGQAKVVGKVPYVFCKMGDKVVCRSIPMSFNFPNNHQKFMEDVTFTFDKEGRIEALAFALGQEAKTDIFDRAPGKWPEESKMILATFLENYKTAFALKRLGYIESIFDDNALIIVGHLVKKKEWDSEHERYTTNVEFKKNRVSKDEYIKRLGSCFNSNEYINIRFTNNDVTKMGEGGELYGIQICQDYYSTNYGDTGYLFLLVDVNDPEHPTIFVRTWQPVRDPNINGNLPKDHPNYGIFTGGYF